MIKDVSTRRMLEDFHAFLDKWDAEIYYTIHDDGIHIGFEGTEILIGHDCTAEGVEELLS